MQTWRAYGLVWAVLGVALGGGCGGDGGNSESTSNAATDADAEVDDERDAAVDASDGFDAAEDDVDADSAGEEDADDETDANMSCEPKGCSELGYECGTPDDGCGDPLDCGSCDSPDTCGGGGQPYVCGCTPKTCEELQSDRGALVCGVHADGCGGQIDCGTSQCTGVNTCGGGGVVDECGCAPNLEACAGKQCGTADDGCGNTVQCGENAGQCGSAARACGASQTCECKTTDATICAGGCGIKSVDGCSIDCGPCSNQCASGASCAACTCPGSEVCSGSTGTCCTPEAPATTCGAAQCGTAVNNCGVVVNCGQCQNGDVCAAGGKCENPVKAALVGKYAVRSVGFGVAASMVTRAEGLLLVEISQDSGGQLTIKEQSCASAGYVQGPLGESNLTAVGPALSKNLVPTVLGLDLSQSKNVPGPKEWVRDKQPPEQNVTGWRRGWPTYCPAGSGAPDASLPGYYGPQGQGSSDPRALGALKPWLGGAACFCPAEEVAKRGLCAGKTGSERAACVSDWAQNALPFAPNKASVSSDVTDCRVVDDDLDGFPGTTSVLNYLGSATLRTTSVFANVFWGAIDTSGAKKHWGVSQDQTGLAAASVACESLSGLGAVACSTGGGTYCPGYPTAAGTVPSKDNRVNPIDFAPLDSLPEPAGGWTCQAIYDRKASLFGTVNWNSEYPNKDICTLK